MGKRKLDKRSSQRVGNEKFAFGYSDKNSYAKRYVTLKKCFQRPVDPHERLFA